MPQGDLTASTPKLTPPAKLKAATLGAKAGVQLKVTTGTGGKATATLSVEPKAVGKKGKKPVVIATGSATLKADAGQAQPVTLRATAAGRRQLRKLRGKRATITLIVGGQTATVTITLK